MGKLALFVVVIHLSTASVRAAPPRLDHVFPAGACRGVTQHVTATGDFAAWPVKIWVNRPGVEIEPAEEKGKLRVTVPKCATPGVYWFRLYDAEGASRLRPFIVGTLREDVEKEPNNGRDAFQRVELPVTVNGRLERGGDVDVYAVSLQVGETLVASLEAHRNLASPMDGVLQVCDRDGFVLDQNDDCRGLDPQIAFTAKQEGDHQLRVFAFPATPNSTIGFAGKPDYVYRLTLTTDGFLDHAMPMAVAAQSSTDLQLFGWNLSADPSFLQVTDPDEAESVTIFRADCADRLLLPASTLPIVVLGEAEDEGETPVVQLPTIISGRIDEPGDSDTVRFLARNGQKCSFRVESRSLGFALDPVLRLSDGDGKVLAEVDDSDKKRDPLLTHTFSTDGEHRLSVFDLHDRGGMRYVYRLTIKEALSDFHLKLGNGAYSVTAGNNVEIPVTIDRREGFGEAIEIHARGLPDGVSCDPVVSRTESETAKAVTLVLAAGTAAVSTPFRIVGISQSTASRQRTARFLIEGTDQESPDAWLTVVK